MQSTESNVRQEPSSGRILGINPDAKGGRKSRPRRKGRNLSPERQASLALARSRMYLLLSLGFRYPSEETFECLKIECEAVREAIRKGFLPAATADGSLQEELERLAAFLEDLDFPKFEAEYLRVFTHVITSDCHPCETAYTATHLFQQANKLSDLNGFYRAFGVTPGTERPDHISVEAEFMAYLAQKEARAASTGRPRRASAMYRTQVAFLETHLGPWVRVFAKFVAIKAPSGPHHCLANLVSRFFPWEFAEQGARVHEISGPPKPLPLMQQKEMETEDDECPVFELACSRQGVLGTHADTFGLGGDD